MANIRIDLATTIIDGQGVTFRSPVDCSQITGLIVYYPENGVQTSREFQFTDAHGNNVGDVDHLFAENVLVKVLLDMKLNRAYVQNADTNSYLENHLSDKGNPHGVTASQVGAIPGITKYYSTAKSADDLDVPLAMIPISDTANAGLYRALGSTSFAYVFTLFFSKMDNTANRVQLGFAYNATNAAMAMRRYLNGNWTEWVSVAGTRLELGKEYLTAELYNNKPVYTMLFNGGVMSDGAEIDYPGIANDAISVIRANCTVGRIPIPQKAFGTWGTSAANSYRFASYVVSENSISVSCASSLVGETIYVQIWYTKG